MGTRMTQHMGLNLHAENLVREYEEEAKEQRSVHYITLPDGTKAKQTLTPVQFWPKKEPSGKVYYGMADEEFVLNKYTTHEGKVYEEYVQASPWSSGPCIFLALKDENGTAVKETLWTYEEINSV